jgi:cell wall-associated NlpC family hydrolase
MANSQIANDAISWMRTHGHVSHDEIDCSHFVWQVLKESISGIPYMPSYDFPHSPYFRKVDGSDASAEAGDIVYWPGHVGIVIDPMSGEFIGSQNSSGVSTANYKSNPYWRTRVGRQFFRVTAH